MKEEGIDGWVNGKPRDCFLSVDEAKSPGAKPGTPAGQAKKCLWKPKDAM